MSQHSFYVVTKPTPHSTLGDVCFETDAKRIVLQALGGLQPNDILLTTTDRNEAEEFARAAIAKARLDR